MGFEPCGREYLGLHRIAAEDCDPPRRSKVRRVMDFETRAKNWRADFPEIAARVEQLILKYAEPLTFYWKGAEWVPPFKAKDGSVPADAVDFMVRDAASYLDCWEALCLPEPTGTFSDIIVSKIESHCQVASYCMANLNTEPAFR